MMASWRPKSLRKWLSRWLAALTFFTVALICVPVYYATNLNLVRRQDALLAQKMEVIQHLIAEATEQGDLGALRHKLSDFFYGRPGFALTLSIDGQVQSYGDQLGPAGAAHERRIRFTLPVPGKTAQRMDAELVLDTSPDIHLRAALAWTMFACAITGAIIAAAAGSWLVRRALHPVDELAQQAAALSPDRIRERLDGRAQADEIQPLVDQFNAMLQRLERAYVQLEGFNADVAHELRTPLATLIVETEYALSTKLSEEGLRETFGSHLEELQRLSSVVNDMLFLSQADRGAQARGAWVSSLVIPISEVAQYHEAELIEADVAIGIRGDSAARIDRTLFQRAVSNLVSNAVRYAKAQSTIDISVAREAKDIVVAVTNTGQPIAEEHLPRLFHRFYRTDPAREFASDHHGLGLAIVAAIARMHGGRSFARSVGGVTTIGFSVGTDPKDEPTQPGTGAPTAASPATV